MKKTKLMIVTTGRADYGLLYPLIQQVSQSEHFEPQLVATGSHLSPLHGETIHVIENDPTVKLTGKIHAVPENDSENAVCNSVAKGLSGFSHLLDDLHPDMIVVLGDRYELWSICMAGVIHKVPIAHIHGGETTYGLIDDPIRHSVTKMASFHFASINIYAKRIIQMGELPERVFVTGAIGLDNNRSISLLSREELSNTTGVDFKHPVALMTYHPVTLDAYGQAEHQITTILNSLLQTDLFILVTMPNADTSGQVIYRKIKEFCSRFPDKMKLVKNLGQKNYLSAMTYSKLMIGNSSSGIIESASFKLPVINIGDRQAGRHKPGNIIDCICTGKDIERAVNKALSNEFQLSIDELESPYGDGHTAARILRILESIDLSDKPALLKKGFYDLPIDLSQINTEMEF